MEIKQGDTVRVSKDIPQFYRRYNSYRVFEVEHQVVDIEDGIALLDSIPSKYVTTIPVKYLVKVEAEAKEAKYRKGDRVKFKNIYELQKVKDKSFRWMLVMFASKEATITAVEDNGFYRVDIDPSIGGINDDMIECKVEPTEQTEAEYTKTKGDTLTFPIAFDLNEALEGCDCLTSIRGQMRKALREIKENNKPRYVPKIIFNTEFWVKYEADLAKEVALKLVNNENPDKIGEVAAKVAKSVVENLKK
jgi:hypothetical protein